ncbi:TetR family transcriptional regulator [Actinomycetospora sp. OC33-EN08]|uniref:TetR family transcriptional regulator n=1 Tax=Actinomycetospora aurantiaca TaxID=3129233 RepID=A0ABU8MUD4_9PSEU
MVRADAQRNIGALLEAATEVFATAGVDAPVRAVAARAGVGVGTVYRHYPKRSDLVAAVFRHQVDACAEAAPVLAAQYGPGEALERWLGRFVDFLATKRGLAAALHSSDPAFDALPAYFETRFVPALTQLLDAAVAAGEVRDDVPALDLLNAVAHLCLPADGVGPDHARRMTTVLARGLRA